MMTNLTPVLKSIRKFEHTIRIAYSLSKRYLDQFSQSISSNPEIAIELASAKRKICELESKLESIKTSNIAAAGVAVNLQLTEHLRHHGVFKEVDGS